MLDLSELTKYINDAFIKIDDANKLDLLESLFQSYLNSICANDKKLLNRFGQNFLHIYIESVKNLHKEDKDNIVSHFAKCFQLRENSDLTRLPIGQMPYGLLDYVAKFFSSERTNNLVCEPDYRLWQETMYSRFGVQWVCLNRGPCWEYEEEVSASNPLLTSTPEVTEPHESATDVAKGTE